MNHHSIPIYRIINKNNLEKIFQTSRICCSLHPDRDADYVPIGETALIQSRSTKKIIIDKSDLGTLSEYIPFYFGNRPPMLYAIQHGYDVPKLPAEDVVYLVSSLNKLKEHGCKYIFTDGHAYDALSQFFNDEAFLANIDWEMVHNRVWKNTPNDPDRKRRKQAECLISMEMPLAAIDCFVVYNQRCLEFVQNLLQTFSLSNFNVHINSQWYY